MYVYIFVLIFSHLSFLHTIFPLKKPLKNNNEGINMNLLKSLTRYQRWIKQTSLLSQFNYSLMDYELATSDFISKLIIDSIFSVKKRKNILSVSLNQFMYILSLFINLNVLIETIFSIYLFYNYKI